MQTVWTLCRDHHATCSGWMAMGLTGWNMNLRTRASRRGWRCLRKTNTLLSCRDWTAVGVDGNVIMVDERLGDLRAS